MALQSGLMLHVMAAQVVEVMPGVLVPQVLVRWLSTGPAASGSLVIRASLSSPDSNRKQPTSVSVSARGSVLALAEHQ
jgi:hypothetical protein